MNEWCKHKTYLDNWIPQEGGQECPWCARRAPEKKKLSKVIEDHCMNNMKEEDDIALLPWQSRAIANTALDAVMEVIDSVDLYGFNSISREIKQKLNELR